MTPKNCQFSSWLPHLRNINYLLLTLKLKNFAIDLNDVENEGEFVDSNGVKPTYTKWARHDHLTDPSNEPDNKHEFGSPSRGANFVILKDSWPSPSWYDVGNMDVHVICNLLCNAGNQIIKMV